MSRARDRRALGARDLGDDRVGDLVDVAHVLVARDDERRRAHVREPRRRRRVEPRHLHLVSDLALERGPLHLRDEYAHLRVDAVREPEPQVRFDGGIEVAALEGLLFLGAERAHLVGPLVAGEAGADEYERRDALRRLERELERDRPAEGRADERDRLLGKSVADEGAVVEDVGLVGPVPEAGQVEGTHGRERLELLPVHPGIGDARVQKDAFGQPSSANRGRMYSSNVASSQLATVAGVSARTDAVRGMCIASATSPK